MEKYVTLLIPILMGSVLLRFLFLPLQWGIKLTMHVLCGLICLWLLNGAFSVTGVEIPIDQFPAALSGIIGIPGIGALALLEILPLF